MTHAPDLVAQYHEIAGQRVDYLATIFIARISSQRFFGSLPEGPFRMSISRLFTAAFGLAALTSVAAAQSTDLYSEMHWREIGPTRGGRARALSGVAGQPNVFYVGYDNG
ncbi:MAG: hypothetical protein ABI026_02745, partial [Gemmatimonadaceae bacterium]